MVRTTTRTKTRKKRAAPVKAVFPLCLKRRVTFATRLGLIELEWVWCSPGEWKGRPESAAPGWSVRSVGPFVLALRLLV
jgi:hypothetical protein